MRSIFRATTVGPLAWAGLCLLWIAAPAAAQEINLRGASDFHAHQGPDSTAREIDAGDLAKLGKSMGMRGMMMKNHWESTAALVYMIRKEVPGIELFGGITQGLLDFMNALHKEGISVADINIMVKTNPAIALGLKP